MTPVDLAFAALGIAGCVVALYMRREANGLRVDLFYAERREQTWAQMAIEEQQRLAAVRRQRSETTRRGNETKAAKRKAEIAARADELRRDVAERVAG